MKRATFSSDDFKPRKKIKSTTINSISRKVPDGYSKMDVRSLFAVLRFIPSTGDKLEPEIIRALWQKCNFDVQHDGNYYLITFSSNEGSFVRLTVDKETHITKVRELQLSKLEKGTDGKNLSANSL